MKPFSILSVAPGAHAEYPEGSEHPVLHKFTDIRVRIAADFDWEKDGPALLAKLREGRQT